MEMDNAKKMKFGNEETFELIKQAVLQGCEQDYAALYEIISADSMTLIKKYQHKYQHKLQFVVKEDMVHEVVFKVFNHLPQFYTKSEDKTPQQRNAYLKTIVHNEYVSYIRKENRWPEFDTVRFEDQRTGEAQEDVEERMARRIAVLEALKDVFQIRTSPEKIIGFIYNKVLNNKTGINGSPKEITEELNGIPIVQAFKQMAQDLSEEFGEDIPQYVLAPLWEQIEKYPNRPFDITVKSLTEGSSRIQKKMKEKRNND